MSAKEVKPVRGVFERDPGSSIWWIRYEVHGKRRREKVGRRSDAIALYQQRKSEARAGVKLPANMRFRGVTVKEICESAVKWYEGRGSSDLKTIKGRSATLVEALGHRPANDLTPGEIDAWLAEHTWTPATMNRYKTTLSKAYRLALADGKVEKNPARLVAHRPENNGRIRYLLEDEEKRLREVVTKAYPKQMPAFEVALHTGMRQSEQFSLTWDQVDFARKRIYLGKTKNKTPREVPMSKTCEAVLLALSAEKTNQWVFQASHFKEKRRLQSPKKWFENSIERAKIQDFTWHSIRHTFCSRLVMRGVDLRTVAQLAGHKTIQMTMRYSHLAPEHNQRAIEMLD